MSNYRIKKTKPIENPKISKYDILTAGVMRNLALKRKVAPQDLKSVARFLAFFLYIFSLPYDAYMKIKMKSKMKAKIKEINQDK